MYGCESWTVKKVEHRRNDAFELWCWRRLLRVPWTARRSNQSILKEISSGISLEGMMLNWNSSTLVTSWEELTHWKKLMQGDDRGKMAGWHYQLDGHEFEQALGAGDGQGSLACCSPWGHKESDMTEQLNWTELWKRQVLEAAHLFFSLWWLTHRPRPNMKVKEESEKVDL